MRPTKKKEESRDRSSRAYIKNFSVNSLLTKSGRARPSFKAILRLSSLSAFRFSLLATVLGEGGVLLLPFAELEEMVDVKDVFVEEGAGARSKGGFDVAARGGFVIVDWRTIFTLFVEGDSTFIVFLGSGVSGSGFSRSFVGVIGVNQSAYSWSKILEGGVGDTVSDCRWLWILPGLETGV